MPKNRDKIDEFVRHLEALENEWTTLKAEVEGRIARLKRQVAALAESDDGVKPTPGPRSQAKAQSGNFPCPVGRLVKAAFPELFRRKLLSAGDIAYLLSEKAAKDFRTRGQPVLRLYAGKDDPGLYACGYRRFYKIPPLELGSKKYHLSSQFYPESRDAVLKWLYDHGMKKSELVALVCPKGHAGVGKTRSPGRSVRASSSGRHAAG